MALTEEFKKAYHERYMAAKQKGVKFWPDVIYKDLLVSFALFIILVMLATFLGVAGEPKADPSDSAYIPKPEWYFLFLYEALKFFPGSLAILGTFVLPSLVVGVMLLLPFIDRNPSRYFTNRKIAIAVMVVAVLGIIGLTLRAELTPHEAAAAPETVIGATLPEQIVAGSDLYSVNCVECHGAEGEGGEIQGVEGLEGFPMKPINSSDQMYTRTDETLANVIAYGQPDLGMPPYGKAYGGPLSVGEIDAIVTFMRYTWDDRAELPQEAAGAFAAPALGADETPSYEVHISWLAKRYCVSCHRQSASKANNNYFMETYEEIMTSGDDAPNNVRPFDLNSNLIRMIHREEIEAGGPMPPTQPLKPEFVEWFERWVMAGAPESAADAAAAPGAVVTNTLSAPAPVVVTPGAAITDTLSAPAPVEATLTPTP